MTRTGRPSPAPRCGVLDRELARLGAPPAPRSYRPDRPCPAGCNCVRWLLGPERYDRELAAGAFFLLEAWALDWSAWAAAVFGGDDRTVGEILRREHRSLVVVRTTCSGDFRTEAEAVARRTGLPLRWLDALPDPAAGAEGGAA